MCKKKVSDWDIIFVAFGVVVGYITPNMTKQELKSVREQKGFTQIKMAEMLNVPVSTYRKWEQGDRKVPGIVAASLAGKNVTVRHLSTDEAIDFAKKTSSEGVNPDDVVAELIRKWISGGITLAVGLCLLVQIAHPDHGQARRFGSRRKQDGVEAVEIVDGDCAV